MGHTRMMRQLVLTPSNYLIGAHQKLLGSTTQEGIDNTNAGVPWTPQAGLAQGFASPLDCYVQINTSQSLG